MGIKLGFIGNGNMGYAILKGVLDQKVLSPEETAVYDPAQAVLDRAKALGCHIFSNENELVENCDMVLAAVKPQYAGPVFETIGRSIKGKLLVSIVAGMDVAKIRSFLKQEDVRILRIMPNTPALVGEGVFGMDMHTDALAEEKQQVEKMMESLGMVQWIDESLFPVITGLSGGGPAYVAMMIEALADGGVMYGLRRDVAIQVAAQTVFGSAKLILDGDIHPAVAKDNVCSPAGTTIAGVKALEDHGFRAAVMDAIAKSTEKAKNL